ncbi:hypothetical protein GQ44DRAFT_717580 [Phaeosphaeriaceae sp. PMI808]|nr:hypothetical protein GQ44DRAFT_717580 [Phaeosphaeriaceae sp. PMI808]
MATTETAPPPHDRHSRKRPFAGWMKRLANLKPSSSDSPSSSGKKSSNNNNNNNNNNNQPSKTKKGAANAKNNPYPESGVVNTNAPGHLSFSTPNTQRSTESFTSVEEGTSGQQRVLTKSNRSTAPTVATVPETVHSARSKADTGTSHLMGGNSTFSSPNGSEHSLTTTLTTIQSTAPSNILAVGQNQAPTINAPPQQPNSYQGATANNMLTDNASILTLASSSKRRRRNSLDTNASVRALAPSSNYGGSRESLPLSVLSANPDTIYSPSTRPSNVGGFANAERASVYSASGVAAPAIASERNSFHAAKQNTDGLSIRSGLLGHGRTDSIGSIRATPTSPLASPREVPGKMSRRSSDWKDAREANDEDEASASPTTGENDDKLKPQKTT